MIWSKLDFAREVRRQLVELESIRQRVPADSEVRQRIDRLEASHLNLLRKLEDVFPSPGPSSSKGAPRGSFERHLRTVLLTSELQKVAAAIRERIALQADPRTENPSASRELPALDTLCATCGKLLLSSLLAGAEVSFHESAWHHSECCRGGEGFRKPGMLN